MAYHPTSGRDPSPPAFSGASGISLQAGESFTSQPLHETDLAELTARFAASSGPGLSRELSADLALEIVLHEIVEQACLATGASGAAIVLQRDGEMVCRASSGPTAPELGARLDGGSGLSGECIRTRQVQRCEDAQVDPRADGEASRRLGVRSVVVFPLLQEESVLGIFEAFSSRAAAFGERDEGTLEALAGRVLKNLVRAAQPLVEQAEEGGAAIEDAIADRQANEPEPAAQSRHWMDIATWALGAVVLVCAVWLGIQSVQRFLPYRTSVQSAPASAPPGGTQITESAPGRGAGLRSQGSPSSAGLSATAKVPGRAPNVGRRNVVSDATPAPEGSLLVYENGKEVFRMPPAPGAVNRTDAVQRAASVESENVMELTPEAAEDSLIHRVEPEYPEQARQEQIQGAVVLEARIRADGTVETLKVVSGPALLVDAAMAAVTQWRFRPHQINGKPAEMQTTITLNFRLPR